jgi:glycosyltransferase involved in cell wall biosynthesis
VRRFNSNPFIVQNARFTVLTEVITKEHYVDVRGLLALGTPVVVDCNSGPREIVIDEYNGLLVAYNAINLAAAFNRMISDRSCTIFLKKMQQKCCAFIFRNDFKTMGIHFTLKQ